MISNKKLYKAFKHRTNKFNILHTGMDKDAETRMAKSICMAYHVRRERDKRKVLERVINLYKPLRLKRLLTHGSPVDRGVAEFNIVDDDLMRMSNYLQAYGSSNKSISEIGRIDNFGLIKSNPAIALTDEA